MLQADVTGVVLQPGLGVSVDRCDPVRALADPRLHRVEAIRTALLDGVPRDSAPGRRTAASSADCGLFCSSIQLTGSSTKTNGYGSLQTQFSAHVRETCTWWNCTAVWDSGWTKATAGTLYQTPSVLAACFAFAASGLLGQFHLGNVSAGHSKTFISSFFARDFPNTKSGWVEADGAQYTASATFSVGMETEAWASYGSSVYNSGVASDGG